MPVEMFTILVLKKLYILEKEQKMLFLNQLIRIIRQNCI